MTVLNVFHGRKLIPITFKKDDNKEFRLVQNLTREAVFNQFMQLINQLVFVAETFAREENFSRFVILTLSKDMEKQLQLAHKQVDIVDRANRKIYVTLLRYSVDKPQSLYAQVHFFARKNEVQNFEQIVYVNSKLEKFICLLDVMKSVNDNIIAYKPICNII